MPAFDFSGIGLKAKASQDYGFLIDQVQIKENQLASDGKLAPGDYDKLISDYQKVYSHPGLSKDQRSNIDVKISQLQSNKKVSSQRDLSDINRLNNETQDDFMKNTMLLGNNPAILLEANAASMRLKIDRLSQSIDQLSFAGDDPSNHLNEYNDALSQYNDVLQALDDVKNYKPGEKPTSNYVAYVTTNSAGEISDVQVARTGSKSGYAETNGLYGGLQIYGKINKKEFGKNVFQIGNKVFSGSDLTIQDPTTPGAFRSAPLLSESSTGGRTFGVIGDQFDEVVSSDPFKEKEVVNPIRTQSAIRSGGWAQGSNGFIYQKLDNGQYKKYVNAKKEDLGISDNDIIRIPRALEQSILPSVTETIDGSKPFEMPVSASAAPNISASQSTVIPYAAPQSAAGTSRTPSPTVRSPQTAQGMASKALSAGKGLLNYIFGGNK